MLKTILLLIFGLIILPFIAFHYDDPLSDSQWRMLTDMFTLMCVVAFYCFVVSEITRNYSQVDKLWSIMPVVYTWYFAWSSSWDQRLVLIAILVSIWGIRLTYNFWRRGGYHWIPWKGEEDYRWDVLKQNPLLKGRVRWGLFNLFFISFYQQGLVLLITVPAVYAWNVANPSLNWLDFVAAGLFLIFVIVETIADQQQYDFQQEKYRRLKNGEPLNEEQKKGFCSTGLWSSMRHPNYMAEQGVWLTLYLFSVAATGSLLNGSLVGAVLLLMLFQGSSDFSEKISSEKYPGYKQYQNNVGRFIPKLK